MKAHRPKTAALVAYADGLLSSKGRARLERHLARCAACRRELAAIRTYESMADAARETPVPELDFGRMELALAREARRVSGEIEAVKQPRRWRTFGIVAVAAAALVALALSWPEPQRSTVELPPTSVDPVQPSEPAPPEPARLAPIVTLAAGTAEELTGEARALDPGAALDEGDRLRTGDDGLVHVAIAGTTGVVAEHRTEIVLTRAREDAVELTLERGRVSSQVAPLASQARYVVLAAGHAIEVRGTRFAVARTDDDVAVDLAEGHVAVRTPAGETIELVAPARWRSSGGSQGEPEEVAVPRQRSEGTPVRFAHPELVRWQIDGEAIASAGAVRMRLSPGEHELRGWDLRGRLFTAVLPVGTEPVFLEPAALRPEAPRLRPGHLEEAVIARVIQRARRQLAGCYERALRIHPEVHGRLRLRVTVGLMGDVLRVSVLGADAADTNELRQCISTYARRWTFPPPGGPVTFEVPLAFSARL